MHDLAENPTVLPLRAGVEARELNAIVDAFASDAVVRSPITNALTFEGHAQIGAVFGAILETFQNIRYTDELRVGDAVVLVASASVASTDIELVDHIRLDENGKISELTVFFRPLPAIAVAARALGEHLAARKSTARARLVSALVLPLVLLTRVGDRVAAMLVRPAL